ncbi:MAG: zinc ABC transporter substrate-binding protein [Porphyromonas sp.]|nr:zinc ABC transporter substrate-binding protein [Porphyromonas sp.]
MFRNELIVSNIRKIFCVALLLLTLSCSNTSRSGGQHPEIMVSIAPQKFFAKKLLGDIAEVKVLVPPGANPESFDPTPNTLLSLSSCKAFFYMGSLTMENTLIDAISESGVRLIDLSGYVPKEAMDAYGVDHVCSHPGHHDSHFGDPHYWSSILGGRAIAKGMFETLQSLFPEYKELLHENYLQLSADIDRIEKEIQELKSQSSIRSFVIYHPSLSFFSGEWELNQIAVEREGKEPTPQHIEQLIEEAKTQNAGVVLLQQEFNSSSVESIAKALSLKTFTINPLSEEWDRELLDTAKAIFR